MECHPGVREGQKIPKFILWGQSEPDTKTKESKEKILQNTIILGKILLKLTEQYRKRIKQPSAVYSENARVIYYFYGSPSIYLFS